MNDAPDNLSTKVNNKPICNCSTTETAIKSNLDSTVSTNLNNDQSITKKSFIKRYSSKLLFGMFVGAIIAIIGIRLNINAMHNSALYAFMTQLGILVFTVCTVRLMCFGSSIREIHIKNNALALKPLIAKKFDKPLLTSDIENINIEPLLPRFGSFLNRITNYKSKAFKPSQYPKLNLTSVDEVAATDITLDTRFHYRVVINVRPKAAHMLNIVNYKIMASNFNNLAPLFNWCAQYDIPIRIISNKHIKHQ